MDMVLPQEEEGEEMFCKFQATCMYPEFLLEVW